MFFDNDNINDDINDDVTPTADEDPTVNSTEDLPAIPDDLTQDEDFFNAIMDVINQLDAEKEDKDA